MVLPTGLLRCGIYRYVGAVVALLTEHNGTIGEGKQGVVFANTHVFTGVVFGSALTHDDVSADGFLTTKDFYAESLTVRFTSVLGTTDSFLMCHDFSV